MKNAQMESQVVGKPLVSAIAAGLGMLCLGIIPAAAQTPGETSAGVLEEVTVTAQRREENLQTTPIAISAYSGEMLEANRILNVFDLANNTPSFSLTANTPLDLEMNIRGITNTRLDSPTADPSIGLFFDDVYIGRTGGMNTDFYDIERIEVIRGPQGVLLGKNVVGGALSVYSRRPEFENSGEVMVSLGNYSSVLTNGYYTGGLTDSLAGRFSFQYRAHDGYSYDAFSNRETDNLDSLQLRGQLAYQPEDSIFSARFVMDYNTDSTNGIGVVAIPDDAPGGLRPWSTLRAFLGMTDPRVAIPDRNKYAGDDFYHTQHLDRDGIGLMLNMQWAFSGSTLTSITGYRDVTTSQLYDQTGATQDVFDELFDFSDFLAYNPTSATFLFSEPVREDTDIKQFSQEVRLTSESDSNWDWIIGAYYKNDSIDKWDRFFGENPSGALPTLSGESHWINNGKMESLAGFAQVGYRFNDAWKLTLGGRYTKDDKSGYVQGIAVATGDRFHPDDPVPLTPLTGSFATPYGNSWSQFTPQGILEFQQSDDWYWYGTIGTGFKGGGYEDTPANVAGAQWSFNPEEVINYEMGFKSTLMEGRMRLNVSIFYMDYTDLQVQQTNEDCLCNITDNASDARIQGIEAEWQWAVSEDFRLFASGSMLDHEYRDFLENSGVDSSGNKLQRTPDNQFSVGFDWTFGSGNLADAFLLNLNYYWQDEMYWQPSNMNTEDSYGLWNGRIAYAHPNSSWSISAWIKNGSDVLYRYNIIPFFGEEVGQHGAPRTWGFDFRIGF